MPVTRRASASSAAAGARPRRAARKLTTPNTARANSRRLISVPCSLCFVPSFLPPCLLASLPLLYFGQGVRGQAEGAVGLLLVNDEGRGEANGVEPAAEDEQAALEGGFDHGVALLRGGAAGLLGLGGGGGRRGQSASLPKM